MPLLGTHADRALERAHRDVGIAPAQGESHRTPVMRDRAHAREAVHDGPRYARERESARSRARQCELDGSAVVREIEYRAGRRRTDAADIAGNRRELSARDLPRRHVERAADRGDIEVLCGAANRHVPRAGASSEPRDSRIQLDIYFAAAALSNPVTLTILALSGLAFLGLKVYQAYMSQKQKDAEIYVANIKKMQEQIQIATMTNDNLKLELRLARNQGPDFSRAQSVQRSAQPSPQPSLAPALAAEYKSPGTVAKSPRQSLFRDGSFQAIPRAGAAAAAAAAPSWLLSSEADFGQEQSESQAQELMPLSASRSSMSA